MFEDIFKYKYPVKSLLIDYGFTECDNYFTYSTLLKDTDMTLTLNIYSDGTVDTNVTDNVSCNEYTLYKFPQAEGIFVGHIRELCDEILMDISVKCFKKEVFKSKCVKKVISYFREKYGDELEFLWEKLPDCAVVRRKDNQKWYAIIMTVLPSILGLKGDKKTEILDIRCLPEDIESTVDGIKILPGYHMNKKHWITVLLDGSVDFEDIKQMIDASYLIAAKRK